MAFKFQNPWGGGGSQNPWDINGAEAQKVLGNKPNPKDDRRNILSKSSYYSLINYINLSELEIARCEELIRILGVEWALQSKTVRDILMSAFSEGHILHIYTFPRTTRVETETRSLLYNWSKTLETVWYKDFRALGLTLQLPESQNADIMLDKGILNDLSFDKVSGNHALTLLDEFKHVSTNRPSTQNPEGGLVDHYELYPALLEEINNGILTVSPGVLAMVELKAKMFTEDMEKYPDLKPK